MKKLFSSDHHFGHLRTIKFFQRPFKDVQEMHKIAIKKWNEKANPEDIIYYVGDFAFLEKSEIKSLLNQLNGYKILVRGNNDKLSKEEYLIAGFHEVHDELKIKIKNEIDSIINHYPFIESSLSEFALKKHHFLFTTSEVNEDKQREYLFELEDLIINKKFDEALISFSRKIINPTTESGILIKKILDKTVKQINNGFILIHGHTHSKNKTNLNQINVCADAWDFNLVDEETIYSLAKQALFKLYEKQYNLEEALKSIEELSQINNILSYNCSFNPDLKERSKYIRNVHRCTEESLEIIKNKNTKLHYIPNACHQDFYNLNKKYKTYIPKEKLKKGSFYIGKCRNARISYWDGSKFTYARNKFGHIFLEDINTLEDDNGFDLFIPHKKMTKKDIEHIKELNILKELLKIKEK